MVCTERLRPYGNSGLGVEAYHPLIGIMTEIITKKFGNVDSHNIPIT